MYEQLELPIDRVADAVAEPVVSIDEAPAAPPVETPEPDEPDPREPFGAWLLAQQHRRGLIGLLARAAKADAGFPRRGLPDDVRSRLTLAGAESDMFEAIDDAETAWLSGG